MAATVKDVPVVSIVFTSLGDLLTVLCGAGIAVCIALLARRAGSGKTFVRASSATLLVLAAVVFVGIEGADVLHAIGSSTVGQVALGWPQEPDGMWVAPGSNVVFFELWPVFVSAGLVALAAVFRAGAQYRKDSEGLV